MTAEAGHAGADTIAMMLSRLSYSHLPKWIGWYLLACVIAYPVVVVMGGGPAWRQVVDLGYERWFNRPRHVYVSDEGDVAVQVMLITKVTHLISTEWSGESFYAIADTETIQSLVENEAEKNARRWKKRQEDAPEGAEIDRQVTVAVDTDGGWRWTESVSHGPYRYYPHNHVSDKWIGADKDRLLGDDFKEPAGSKARPNYAVYQGYTLSDGTIVKIWFDRLSARAVDAVKPGPNPYGGGWRLFLKAVAVVVDFVTAPLFLSMILVFGLGH